MFLNPFTVPVGGNALAIVNLEARIPVTRSLQVVPFYDGGNVFRRVGDLFGKDDDTCAAGRCAGCDQRREPARALDQHSGSGIQNSNAIWRRAGDGLWIPAESAGVSDSAAWAKRHLTFDGTPAIYRLKRTQVISGLRKRSRNRRQEAGGRRQEAEGRKQKAKGRRQDEMKGRKLTVRLNNCGSVALTTSVALTPARLTILSLPPASASCLAVCFCFLLSLPHCLLRLTPRRSSTRWSRP